MDKEIINIFKNHGCLYMADDYKELLNDIENHYKQAQALQSLQTCVSSQVDKAETRKIKPDLNPYSPTANWIKPKP